MTTLRDFGKSLLEPFAKVTAEPESEAGSSDAEVGAEGDAQAHAGGPIDEEYVRVLDERVNGSTLPGYEEFTRQLKVLAEDIPEEPRLYKAALKSTAVSFEIGLDKAAVLAAVDDRLRILGEHETQFNREVDADEQKVVGGTESRLAAAQQELIALTSRRDAMQLELANNKARFATKREKYNGALDTLRAKLAAQRKKIDSYLK